MKCFLTAFVLLMASCSHHREAYNEYRSEKNRLRDVYRHPKETLKFFEISPELKVVEVSPGDGWYTEVLGPILKKKGELKLAGPSEQSSVDFRKNQALRLREKISNQPNAFGKISYSVFEVPEIIGPIAEENWADRVLTFRNIHNWMSAGKEREVFQEFFRVLKPGGILGVVEHRASTTKPQNPKAQGGYVREDFVIALAESVGFEFIANSEINSNHKDPADHPEGVWTLPPSMRMGEKDRAKYLAIGESDRMTIKFRKPIAK